MSNQFGGAGIKDGANVAKSPDVVLAGLAYQAYMFVDESMETPSSLILSDMGMGEPLTST